MAKAPKVGRDGIDSWTSNGYGITVEKDNSKEWKEEVEKLNEEIRNYVNNKNKKK